MVIKQKGTRLSTGAKLSDDGRAFALKFGITDTDSLWEEFVDYWVAVPGQRGIKLDWEATWRNNVRKKAAFKAPKTGYGPARESRIVVAPPRKEPSTEEKERVARRTEEIKRILEMPK